MKEFGHDIKSELLLKDLKVDMFQFEKFTSFQVSQIIHEALSYKKANYGNQSYRQEPKMKATEEASQIRLAGILVSFIPYDNTKKENRGLLDSR